MSAVLKANNASKRFGETVALDDVSLALQQGECLALLGPNGAGKTTLVRAIAGRVRLDSGTIEFTRGTTNQSDRPAHGHLGVVPQDIALYPALTARENLRAFGEFNGVRGSTLQSKIDWALEWSGLANRAREPIKHFSGGMKRRLNIACGVIHDPEIVLLDEPTVGVDPQSRQRIWEMMRELQSNGASLLLTTHQLDEAESICDRIVIIDHGKVIAAGSLDALINDTIGRARRVSLTLDQPLADGLDQSTQWDDRLETDGSLVHYRTEDVAVDLPPLLQAIHDANRRVQDVSIETPSLHRVFIHLTGRTLRE